MNSVKQIQLLVHRYETYKSIVVTLCCLAELSESIFNFQWSAFCALIKGLDKSVEELDTHCTTCKQNLTYCPAFNLQTNTTYQHELEVLVADQNQCKDYKTKTTAH